MAKLEHMGGNEHGAKAVLTSGKAQTLRAALPAQGRPHRLWAVPSCPHGRRRGDLRPALPRGLKPFRWKSSSNLDFFSRGGIGNGILAYCATTMKSIRGKHEKAQCRCTPPIVSGKYLPPDVRLSLEPLARWWMQHVQSQAPVRRAGHAHGHD